jgi:hypothetical protein
MMLGPRGGIHTYSLPIPYSQWVILTESQGIPCLAVHCRYCSTVDSRRTAETQTHPAIDDLTAALPLAARQSSYRGWRPPSASIAKGFPWLAILATQLRLADVVRRGFYLTLPNSRDWTFSLPVLCCHRLGIGSRETEVLIPGRHTVLLVSIKAGLMAC